MAARRLLIVLVLLFAISIAAAAIAPERRQLATPSSDTTTESGREAPPPDAGGREVETEIAASRAKPETVRARVGDRLALSVSSRSPLEVEIRSLGLLEDAVELAPARFDLLLSRAGALPLTDAENGDVIGKVLVGPTGGRKRRSGERKEPRRNDGEHPG